MPGVPVVADPGSWLLAVTKRPYRILSFLALISAFFSFQLKDIRVQTSIYELAIEDLPEAQQYQSFKREFGTEEIILVVLKSGKDAFSPEIFAEIADLSKRFASIQGVRRVISLSEIKKAMDVTGGWSLAEFKASLAPVELFRKNIISEDGRTSAIALVLDEDKRRSDLVSDVEAIIRDKDGHAYQIGMPIVSKALADYTLRDFRVLPPLAMLAISLVLFLILREVRYVLIALSCVALTLLWTFGMMGLTGTPLSMVTMIVPVFLIAVGTAYCLYTIAEFKETFRYERDPARAAYMCMSRVGFPTSLAVATTVIGLGSLLINRITAIREFALFACFGVICLLVLVFTFIPSLLSLMPAWPLEASGKKDEPRRTLMENVLSAVASLALRHQTPMFLLAGAIFVLGAAGLTRLKVETNPVEFFKKDSPIYTNFYDSYKDIAGSFPINVVIDGKEPDFFERPENLKKIDEMQQSLKRVGGVDKTVSLNDYLKLVNYATNRCKAENYSLPEEAFEVRMLINSFKTMLGEDLLAGLVSRDFSKMNIMLRTRLSGSRDFLDAKREISERLRDLPGTSISWYATGFGIVISESSNLLAIGQAKSLSLTLALISIVMLLLFLSLKVGLVSMLPNIFPIVVNFGFMGWAGIPLSSATALIAGIAIGLSVDDTIHYLARYNKEFKKDLDKGRAMRETISIMGRPMIGTTLTLVLGFSVLLVSGFQPTSTFGLLIIITMVSALAGDLFLLPAFMMHLELVTVWDLIRLRLGRPPDEGIMIFQGLSRSQVYYIILAGVLRRFKEGEAVFWKGEKGDSMYAVVAGELEVVDAASPEALARQGRHTISRIGVGDIVGEMGMFRSAPRSATVLSCTDTELLEINERMLKRLNWLYPPTAQRFFMNLIKILCNRLEVFTNRCLALTTTDSTTGFGNAQAFKETMERESKRCRRYGLPLCVATFTLEVGSDRVERADMVAAEMAVLIARNLRETDVVFRISRTTFAAILIHCGESRADDLRRRFQELISGYRFQYLDPGLKLYVRSNVILLKEGKGPDADEIIASSH
jgi:predicted RND superfamily exporter protein/CRP-like cAMP-binding protein